MEDEKWFWMTNYCNKNGMAPANKTFWDQAEKQYTIHKKTELIIDRLVDAKNCFVTISYNSLYTDKYAENLAKYALEQIHIAGKLLNEFISSAP